MTSCSTSVCGVGGWNGPLPGDPDNNSVLTATPAFGGIDVAWSYPATNPEAVAYVQLYRGTSSDFSNAILLATVGGNFFYDKSTSAELIEYFYWIKIVSVNGTVGELIGPASAIAKPLIATLIEQLTGQIDAGLLAQSLKTDIDRITLNYAELTGEISNRIAANNALSAALVQVQSGVDQSLAFIGEEITSRQEGDSALLTQINSVAAANANNLALIQQESTARVDADSALATQINTVASQTTANAAAIITEQTARTNADSSLANSITTLTAASNNNAAAISTESTTRANADSALATQINTAQTTLNGNIASVQTSLQTNINTVDGKVTEIGALYTAKVSVNGLIGGFGVYNDGTTVQAGFDVDEFWVGRTQANKRKPFIISGGVTYIDEAAIEKLTFSKLRDESGSFIVENGKVKADYLTVTNKITVPSIGGNVELGNNVGPVNGHAGLSLSSTNFDNIFLRRSDGVVFFRINEGGTNSLTFDSSSGQLTISGTVQAGNLSAQSMDVALRSVLETGAFTIPLNQINGFVTDNDGISVQQPAGTVFVSQINFLIATNTYDNFLINTFRQQPFKSTVTPTGTGTFSGGNGNFNISVDSEVVVSRRYSPNGISSVNDTRVYIFVRAFIVTNDSTFNWFQLPTALNWTLSRA